MRLEKKKGFTRKKKGFTRKKNKLFIQKKKKEQTLLATISRLLPIKI